MLELPNKTWRLLLLLLVALAFFLGAYFFHWGGWGGYSPPRQAEVPMEKIVLPSSSFESFPFVERPSIQKGILLVDAAHLNNYDRRELVALLSRVADRGHTVEVAGNFDFLGAGERLSLLEEKLRLANSFLVVLPGDPYTREEVDVVEQFVRKGGNLLLVGDPTRRSEINSLAERFGISFQPDYLFNQNEYDLNYQDIFIRNFPLDDELTRGLKKIVLYTAGSIKSSGPGIALTDGYTRSSLGERIEAFYPLVRGSNGRVVAISDLSFMVPPQNSVLDNNRLVSNIADYLTTNDREFHLADFPHFFQGDVDILLGQSSLFEVGTDLKSVLSALGTRAEIRGVENFTRDVVYLGLYADSSRVTQYLDIAGVRVDKSLRTPFTADIPLEGTSIVVLHRSKGRDALVILGDSPGTLSSTVALLRSGDFRDGLVGDFVGVYRP